MSFTAYDLSLAMIREFLKKNKLEGTLEIIQKEAPVHAKMTRVQLIHNISMEKLVNENKLKDDAKCHTLIEILCDYLNQKYQVRKSDSKIQTSSKIYTSRNDVMINQLSQQNMIDSRCANNKDKEINTDITYNYDENFYSSQLVQTDVANISQKQDNFFQGDKKQNLTLCVQNMIQITPSISKQENINDVQTQTDNQVEQILNNQDNIMQFDHSHMNLDQSSNYRVLQNNTPHQKQNDTLNSPAFPKSQNVTVVEQNESQGNIQQENYQKQIEKLQRDIDTNSHILKLAENEIEAKEGIIEEQRIQIEQLQNQQQNDPQGTQEQIQEKQQSIEIAKAEIDELQKQNVQKDQKIENLQQQLDNIQQSEHYNPPEEQTQENNQQQEEIQNLKTQLQVQRQQLDQVSNYEELQTQNQQYQKRIQDQQEELKTKEQQQKEQDLYYQNQQQYQQSNFSEVSNINEDKSAIKNNYILQAGQNSDVQENHIPENGDYEKNEELIDISEEQARQITKWINQDKIPTIGIDFKSFFQLNFTSSSQSAIIMCINAYIIKYLYFEDQDAVQNEQYYHQKKQTSLIQSLAEILEKCISKYSKPVKLVVSNCSKIDKAQYKQISIKNYQQLFTLIQDNIFTFQGPNGVANFIYSVVLSKGIQEISQEMDYPTNQMIDQLGNTKQELINLLLNGVSTTNCFEGQVNVQKKILMKGIEKQSDIGFLSYYDPQLMISKHYKTPKYPIFVIQEEDDFSLLISKNNLAVIIYNRIYYK